MFYWRHFTFEQVTMIPSLNLRWRTASQWWMSVFSISPLLTFQTLQKKAQIITQFKSSCVTEAPWTIKWYYSQNSVHFISQELSLSPLQNRCIYIYPPGFCQKINFAFFSRSRVGYIPLSGSTPLIYGRREAILLTTVTPSLFKACHYCFQARLMSDNIILHIKC